MSNPISTPVAYTVMSPEASIVMGTAFPGTFEDAVEVLSREGYDGVELQVESPETFPVREVASRLRDSGLRVSSLATGPMQQKQGLSLSTQDDDLRARTVSEVKRLVEHASELGTGISLGRIMEPDTVVDAVSHYDLLADSLWQLSSHAAGGARILIEPQNPALVTLITERRLAEQFLARHQLVDIGLIFDTYHVVTSGHSAFEVLQDGGELPPLVQIAGTEGRGAIEFPDTPLESFLVALMSRGYEGWITMEHLQSAGTDTPAMSLSALAQLVPMPKERR